MEREWLLAVTLGGGAVGLLFVVFGLRDIMVVVGNSCLVDPR